MTNYEKIKNMTIEEMAEYFADRDDIEEKCNITRKEAINYVKKWLESEAV